MYFFIFVFLVILFNIFSLTSPVPYLAVVGIVAFYYFQSRTQSPSKGNFIDEYQFSEGFLKKYSKTHASLTGEQRAMVLDALRQYFKLCQQSPNAMVSMPSLAVDEAWHEFILFTREYAAFCQKAFGKYLHHTPAEAMQSVSISQKGLEKAWRLACADEHIDPTNANKLPKLFALDSNLVIAGGFIFALEQFKDGSIDDSSRNGCGGGGGSSGCGASGCGGGGSDGGGSDGGCGGGCGGGGCGGGG